MSADRAVTIKNFHHRATQITKKKVLMSMKNNFLPMALGDLRGSLVKLAARDPHPAIDQLARDERQLPAQPPFRAFSRAIASPTMRVGSSDW